MFFTRILVVLVIIIYVDTAVLKGKALYCRDPDTGKLYTVNSTWPSTVFCGNYTCKLRRINKTEPVRQIIITNINNASNTNEVTEPADLDTEPTEPVTEVITLEAKSNKDPKTDDSIEDKETQEDRYLTENEIQSIASMLHTVKKSDLNAIVDIYNLAQEVYNEIDGVTEKPISDTVHVLKSYSDNFNIKPLSYWYEPKGRPDVETTQTRTEPTIKFMKELPIQGPLTNYEKVPYYYPLSSFQRMSSYVHRPTNPTVPYVVTNEQKSIEEQYTQKLNSPYLLPYSFTYVQNNDTNVKPNVYYKSPWVWSYHKENRYSNPYFKAKYLAHYPTALLNPQLKENLAEVELRPVTEKVMFQKAANGPQVPVWQTPPVSTVLHEVRANYDKAKLIKAYPVRKKVTIERVAKVVKLDELNRVKRSSDDNRPPDSDQFETYVEKVM